MYTLKWVLTGILIFVGVVGFLVLADYMSTTPEQREERQYDRPAISESQAIETAQLKAFNDGMLAIHDYEERWTAQYIGNGRWIVNYRYYQWEVREGQGRPPTATFLGRK